MSPDCRLIVVWLSPVSQEWSDSELKETEPHTTEAPHASQQVEESDEEVMPHHSSVGKTSNNPELGTLGTTEDVSHDTTDVADDITRLYEENTDQDNDSLEFDIYSFIVRLLLS